MFLSECLLTDIGLNAGPAACTCSDLLEEVRKAKYCFRHLDFTQTQVVQCDPDPGTCLGRSQSDLVIGQLELPRNCFCVLIGQRGHLLLLCAHDSA